jgi:hypothetical protein
VQSVSLSPFPFTFRQSPLESHIVNLKSFSHCSSLDFPRCWSAHNVLQRHQSLCLASALDGDTAFLPNKHSSTSFAAMDNYTVYSHRKRTMMDDFRDRQARDARIALEEQRAVSRASLADAVSIS